MAIGKGIDDMALMEVTRHDDGTITINNAPDQFEICNELLPALDPAFVAIDEDTITVTARNGTFHYRVLETHEGLATTTYIRWYP